MNIQKTSEYSQFLSSPFQRPTKESKIQKLMESMRKIGFDYSTPIVVKQVGKFLQVVRGQHRLEAASRLGLPIYFVIQNELTDYDAIDTSETSWSPSDTVSAFAEAGYSHYVYLREFSNTHKLPLVLAARLLSGSNSTNGVRESLTNGEFEITSSESALNVVTVIDALSSKWKFCRVSNFIGAVQAMFLNKSVMWPHFIKRMTASTVVPSKRTSILEYLYLFEEIYNFRLPSDQRIPLSFSYQQSIAAKKITNVRVAKRAQLSALAQRQKSKEENKSKGKIIAGMKGLFLS
jgi:hypothetical protein